VQWFGDLSYSLYLWHWPIIMFTPFITGRPSEAPVMVLLLVISIVVAAASKRWIEDPFRRGVPRERVRMPRARRIGVASAAALAVVVLLTSGVAGYAIEKPHAELCRSTDDGD
jgi:peptidoglycan/LPS O-acetylase OafA/YrhL